MSGKQETGRPQVDLTGRSILLFGGCSYLARSFMLAATQAGARLCVADLPDALRSLKEEIPTVDTVAADVRRLEEVGRACDHAWERPGGVDVVIDFAGVHHPAFDFENGDPQRMLADFKRVVEVNLTGAFIVTMTAARKMIAQRRGHVIHLCSNGSRLSLYGSYAYNATKHAVEGLVKTAAAQLAPFGVRVNAIAPGTVITPLNRSLLVTETGEYSDRARSILAHTPTKRFATPEGVARSLLAMCVDQPHLTGNVIFADDGYNVEGHSWPEGNEALYSGMEALEALLGPLEGGRPRAPERRESP